MSSGPGGFGNAPVTKALVVAAGGASILAQAARASRRPTGAPSHPAVQLLAFSNPGELLFGAFLLYYFRLLERTSGSARYGAYVLIVSSVSAALQAVARRWLAAPPAPAGPYALIFAGLAQFFFIVPPSTTFTVLGCKLSDKAFIYLAGLQLWVSGGLPSLVAGATGLAAGLLYRADLFGIRRLRVPAPICKLLSRTVGKLLESPAPQVMVAGQSSSSSHGGAGAGRHSGAHHVSRAVQRHSRTAAGAGGVAAGVASAPAAVHAAPEPSPEAVSQLTAMGFDEAASRRALQAVGNDVQAAIALLV